MKGCKLDSGQKAALLSLGLSTLIALAYLILGLLIGAIPI